MKIEGPLEQSFTLPPRLSRSLVELAAQQGRSPSELMLDALIEVAGQGEQVTVQLSHDFSRHLTKLRQKAGCTQDEFGIAALESYLEKVQPHEVIAHGASDGAQV